MILADKLRHCGQGKEPAGDVTIFYNSVSGSNTEKVTGGNGSFTFTVPMGYTEVTICMIGGGGSGSSQYYSQNTTSNFGGGRAGAIVSQVVSGLVGGQQVTVTIGAGGAGKVTSSTTASNGNAGGSSSFNGIVAAGGGGGLTNSTTYAGNGASSANCYATTSDGTKDVYSYLSYLNTMYGGQRGFGKGGNGLNTSSSATAQSGVYGAGGGAIGSPINTVTRTSGAGGSGVCKISWA